MTHKITTTNILMGKGIKPGTHSDERYVWIVTDQALKKLKDGGFRFQIEK